MEEAKEMWITNKFVDQPFRVLCIGFLILFVLAIGCVKLGYFELNQQHIRDFLIWDNQMTVTWDRKTLAHEYLEKNSGGSEKAVRT